MGWSAPLDRPERVADVLIGLSREEIVQRSHEGLRFAREHSFEATFDRRIAHLVQVAEAWRAKRARLTSV